GPFRDRCLAQLCRAGWTGIEQSIRYERVWTPPEFRSRYGVFRGSAFGLAHTFLQSAYFRPHNRSEELPGLYLVGASTHPGGGVPIVLTSARLTVDAVIQDWSAQTTRSQRCRSILRKARCGEDVGPQSVPG
ncbi:MAG: hypothetical protein FJX77_04430, partial [Armatimonadetes bacterium]|nr:hypothetical protein [Armatimonadota bacterium]